MRQTAQAPTGDEYGWRRLDGVLDATPKKLDDEDVLHGVGSRPRLRGAGQRLRLGRCPATPQTGQALRLVRVEMRFCLRRYLPAPNSLELCPTSGGKSS